VDNLGGFIVVVLIWIVAAVFDQKKKQARKRSGSSAPPAAGTGGTRSPAPDLKSRLQDALRQLDPELGRMMDGAAGGEQSPAAVRPQPVRPRITAAEVPPSPAARSARQDASSGSTRDLSFMAQAQAAIAERREVAAEHSRGRTAEDHRRFDREIRRVEKAPPAKRAVALPDLGQAVVWREILGPPVALRDGESTTW